MPMQPPDPSPGSRCAFASRDPPSPARGEGKASLPRDLTHQVRFQTANASPPLFFVRRGVRRSFKNAPRTRGAERRETRRFARPPGRLAKPPGTRARRALSVATERRLPAFHQRLFCPRVRASWDEATRQSQSSRLPAATGPAAGRPGRGNCPGNP